MTYDSKCYDLAEHFLGGRPEIEKLRKELAQEIQTTVEAWIEFERSKRLPENFDA